MMESINSALRNYLEEQILPQYDNYDRGHNREHILSVVEGSFELASSYDVNLDMIFTAAIYHDLGLIRGRDIHHLASAEMACADQFLLDFFTPDQLETIAQAIEDHRASSKSAPRTIYGEILSSADRIIDCDTIIKRTYYHGLKHYPECDFEQQLDRMYDHISGKYGVGGYLTIPIMTRRNELGLNALRSKLVSEESFRNYCREVIASLED